MLAIFYVKAEYSNNLYLFITFFTIIQKFEVSRIFI